MKGFRNTLRMNRYLRWMLVFSNWALQGIPNSDKTEKLYKILFTLILTSFLFIIFNHFSQLHVVQALLISFLIAHTLNWLINCNFSNIIIHRLFLLKLHKRKAFDYLEAISKRLFKNESILCATTHGSICYGNLKSSSDIDIALVREKGLINGIKALYFIVKERKIADSNCIPLEIYLMDSISSAEQRFREEKNPVILYDPAKIADKYFKEKLSIAQAKKMNGL